MEVSGQKNVSAEVGAIGKQTLYLKPQGWVRPASRVWVAEQVDGGDLEGTSR